MDDHSPAQRLIAASGLRVTKQRVAVLASFRRGEHLDAETVTSRVRAGLGTVSQQAVYDVLAALTGAGLLRRIEPAGKPALFEVRVRDNHHHLICRDCAVIVDIDCAVGEAPCLEPWPNNGFRIDQAEVTWWGQCPDCQVGSPDGEPRADSRPIPPITPNTIAQETAI